MTNYVGVGNASNLVGFWDFLNGSPKKDTGLADGISQNGTLHGNATVAGNQLVLDGSDDYFDVDADTNAEEAAFDLGTGTVEVRFTQDNHVGGSPDVLVNRGEYDDRSDEGWFGIQVTKNGAVEVIHTLPGANATLSTANGFFSEGDTVKATYSWDETTGATLKVVNITTGAETTVATNETGLTLDLGDNDDEIFTFGAREEDDGDYDRFFDGQIDYVAVYNIDTLNSGPDGAVDGEDFSEVMELGYDDANAPTNQGGDVITNRADLIFGNGGDDTIEGAGGDDTVYGDSKGATLGSNLLINGGLEAGVADNTYQSNAAGLTGWSTNNGAEVWGNGFRNEFSQDGGNFVEIDREGATDRLFQDVTTGNGTEYSFSFDAMQRIEGSDDQLEVYFGGDLVGVVTPGDEWQTFTFTVTGSGSDRVEFREPASDNNTYGPLIDNVSLAEVLEAGAPGDDVIDGGTGNDLIFGQEGDDTLDGGIGNDTLYGDNGGSNPVGRESFNWDPLSDAQIDGSVTQNTGSVDVTYTRIADTGRHASSQNNDDLYVGGIDTGGETIDSTSGLRSSNKSQGDEGDFQWEFSDPVGDVQFNITDIDGDGVVRVTAFDENGDPIEVQLVGGNKLTLLDTDSVAGADTADSQGGYEDNDSPNYSVEVTIPGPVSRIVVEHDQDGSNASGINVTDIYFDVLGDGGAGGDDVLLGSEGADELWGEGGDDTFVIDSASVGAGDTVIGGNGPDDATDNDTLDLRGADVASVTTAADATDAGGLTGTVTFGDGSTLTFSQIETILQDPTNAAPNANDDTATTNEDQSITIPVLANDSDPDGDPLTVTEATSPDGDVTINPNGTITFTPDPDFNGTTSITYTVADPDGLEDTASVDVTVVSVNDAPEAGDDTAEVPEDGSVTIPVLANDTDPDGDPLTVTEASSPDGEVTINPDGTITFEPNPDFNGPTTITYTVADPDGAEDTSTVSINVTPVNDAPEAGDDTAEVPEDGSVTIPVLANDTDPDGDPLTVTEASSPDGEVTINPDGTITFEPNPDFNGPTTITYTVSDPDGVEDTATVDVTVTPADDAPVANDDTAETDEDTPVTIPVLANDTDPDGELLTVTEATSPDGDVTINPDGTITFEPNPDFNGPTTISYTVADPDGNESTGTVDVTVVPVNDAPEAVDDAAETPFDTAIVIPVLANDTDVDGDPLEVISATSPDGDVTINPDGTLTFEPTPGFEGEATINYTIADPDGLTDDAVVTVTVDEAPLDGIVEGTDDGELIDTDYEGDPEGDKIDNEDAIDPDAEPNDDVVEAGGGNDTVESGAGSDTVDGGEGDDLIDTTDPDAGFGAPDRGYPGLFAGDTDPTDDLDSVTGGAGNDTISTGDDNDTIDGGTGDDEIDGGVDDDLITGGEGEDYIVGGEGSDVIDGGDDDDTIYGGVDDIDNLDIEDDGSNPFGPDLRTDNGQDTINGGAGDDLIFGQDDDDVIFGEDGDDTIDGGIDDDLIDGGAGDDELLGGQGNDTIVGGAGDDLIDGGTGDDALAGGADQDTFVNVKAGDVVDGDGTGVDFDTLDLRGSVEPGGSLSVTIVGPDANGNGSDGFVTYFDENGDETGTLVFSEIEEIIPCFTPGTLIATPRGEMRVEDLEPGDRVITRDNGIQQIRWAGRRTVTGAELAKAPQLKPVLIRQGALGHGLPERDMLVSPQHRVLIANEKTQLFFEESEVLVAAKHLVGLEGIEIVDPSEVTYIHVLFDRHEVILSDGAWTESFQPGDQTLGAMGTAQREEILALFPELETLAGRNSYLAARRSLKRHEAQLLTH